ncbi:hypothetical protein HYE18_02975 [Mycoplasmopsis bovis]|nr:hypothetical protein [Mycoplasmopsis bovis]QQH25117.1 hypothetical protein HYE18_02975 [Mycoplasmopsis bovis]
MFISLIRVMGTFIDNYVESNQKDVSRFKWWLNLLVSGKILMGSHDINAL